MAPRATALAIALCTAAFGITYVATGQLELPVHWYDPVKALWSFGGRPSTVAIDFYGRCLWSLAVGGAVFGATIAAARRRTPSPAVLRAGAVIALIAVLGCVGYLAWMLEGRKPVAEPLPEWYVPR
jgi:hypothetical protein